MIIENFIQGSFPETIGSVLRPYDSQNSVKVQRQTIAATDPAVSGSFGGTLRSNGDNDPQKRQQASLEIRPAVGDLTNLEETVSFNQAGLMIRF